VRSPFWCHRIHPPSVPAWPLSSGHHGAPEGHDEVHASHGTNVSWNNKGSWGLSFVVWGLWVVNRTYDRRDGKERYPKDNDHDT